VTASAVDAAIKIEGLSKSYRKRAALRDVSLEVNRGEIFCLIGPDGAGKSSLLHIAAGILRADGGCVNVLGIDALAEPERVKPRLGLMAQGLGHTLSPELSVDENIEYFAAIRQVRGRRKDELKRRLLEATRLAPFAGRAAKNLSGGMKQKLALCCTLIHSPELLLLDEPTTGVDPVSRRDFYEIINEFVREDGVTAVIATSYMDEAERGHRVALLHEGRVLGCGTPERLKAGVGGTLFELEVDDQEAAARRLVGGDPCSEVIPSGRKLILRTDGDAGARIGSDLRSAGIGVLRLEKTEPTMEYVFRSAVRAAGAAGATGKSQPVGELFDHYGASRKVAANGTEVVRARGLVKRFGAFTAIDSVSFEVERGEVFGFLGPNGAGKTTLIKMLCGLLPHGGGGGSVLGIPLGGDGRRIAEKIGYMSQKFSLYNDLRAIENIELFGGVYGIGRSELRSKIEFAVELSDLQGSERQLTKSLPLGLKQRLALACAVLHGPELIFLDEPTSGVDPLARDRFWNIIFELSRRLGITVIVTTHYMEEAERCDRLILMDEGAIQAAGPPAELRRSVAGRIGRPLGVAAAEPARVFELLRRRFERVTYYGATTLVYSRRPLEDRERIAALLAEAGIEADSIRERELPFEDVFIHYIEKRARGMESESPARSA